MVTDIIAVLALVVAAYGAWLSTRTFLWQRMRDDQRRVSDIKVECGESSGFGGSPLVIGTTLNREHVLTVRVTNDGEAPEYVHEISLESEHPSPLAVSVRKPDGTEEVRPRDHRTFDLALDGAQAFEWDKPFRAAVRIASKNQTFYSEYGQLAHAPHHGQPHTVVDPEQVPDAQIARVSFIPGSRMATVLPPDAAPDAGSD
jgi:hypothetical protein